MQFNHGEKNLRYGKKKCMVIKAASSVHAQRDVLIVIPLGGSPIIASLMNIVTTIPLPPHISLSLSLNGTQFSFFLFFFSNFCGGFKLQTSKTIAIIIIIIFLRWVSLTELILY